MAHLLFHHAFFCILSGGKISGMTTHLHVTLAKDYSFSLCCCWGNILLSKKRRLFLDMSSLFISLFPSVCLSHQVPLDNLKNCQSVSLWSHFYICYFSFTFFSTSPFFESSDSIAILTKFFYFCLVICAFMCCVFECVPLR